MAQSFIITEITMDGTEKTHTVDGATRDLSLHAVGGDVDLLDTAGASDAFTLVSGSYMNIQQSNIRDTDMIFKGSAPAKIQILEQTGVLS